MISKRSIDMQLSLNGAFKLKSPLKKTFLFLADSKKLSTCIPNAQKTNLINNTAFTTRFSIGVGFIKGNFDVRCETVPKPPDLVSIIVDGSGAGSRMRVRLSIHLKDAKGKFTDVEWSADAEVGGIISGLGESMLKDISKSKIDEIIREFEKRIK